MCAWAPRGVPAYSCASTYDYEGEPVTLADCNTGCVAPKPDVTFSCIAGTQCIDPNDGSGHYTGDTAYTDCDAQCPIKYSCVNEQCEEDASSALDLKGCQAICGGPPIEDGYTCSDNCTTALANPLDGVPLDVCDVFCPGLSPNPDCCYAPLTAPPRSSGFEAKMIVDLTKPFTALSDRDQVSWEECRDLCISNGDPAQPACAWYVGIPPRAGYAYCYAGAALAPQQDMGITWPGEACFGAEDLSGTEANRLSKRMTCSDIAMWNYAYQADWDGQYPPASDESGYQIKDALDKICDPTDPQLWHYWDDARHGAPVYKLGPANGSVEEPEGYYMSRTNLEEGFAVWYLLEGWYYPSSDPDPAGIIFRLIPFKETPVGVPPPQQPGRWETPAQYRRQWCYPADTTEVKNTALMYRLLIQDPHRVSADHDGYCGWLSVGPGSSAGGVVLTCDPATKQIASIQGGVNLGGVEMPDIASGLASGPASLVRVRDDARTYTTPDIDQEWFLDNGDRPLWLGYVAGVYAEMDTSITTTAAGNLRRFTQRA